MKWCLFFLSWAVPSLSFAIAITAPGAPGVRFSWATSEKQGFGTAYEAYDESLQYSDKSPTAPISKVWFTLARGIVTEVYYPRVDMAQVRDSQIVVTDGKTFLHQEQYDTLHEVERVGSAPLYHVKNTDRWNRYAIIKDIWADPDSDTLIQKIRIERYVDGLQFYVLHKPSAANTLFGDSAYREPFMDGEDHPLYGAWQGLVASCGWQQTSVGYVGASDGFTELQNSYVNKVYDEATNGNVAMTGKLNIPATAGSTEFYLYLFFSPTKTGLVNRFSTINQLDAAQSQKKYVSQWEDYVKSLNFPVSDKTPTLRRNLLTNSILMLKSGEDKTYSGSIIASPSFPWGETQFESSWQPPEKNAGYHVVWPRDLYHIADALLAVDDNRTAVAILNRLQKVQYQAADGSWPLGSRTHVREGSFPQNFWVDGQTVYGGYQADETAMPILLAYRLWKRGLIKASDYWDMVHDAAEFLNEMGPWTQNERWEENYGVSPNSTAYAITALVAASEMGFSLHQPDSSGHFLSAADSWALKENDNIDSWTFTTDGKINGSQGNGRYYLRLEGANCDKDHGGAPIYNAIWNPNVDAYMQVANYQGDDRFKYESEIVDAGFLALTRLGVRSAMHGQIRDSLQEIDSVLRQDTPGGGSGWYRYRYDAYGETGKGRLWPLLTGERLTYELQAAKESQEPNPARFLEPKVQAYESFANDQQIFSEQVWDEGDALGKQTGSASPLLWSHAEYVQLLKSLYDNKVFDEISSVRERYASH